MTRRRRGACVAVPPPPPHADVRARAHAELRAPLLVGVGGRAAAAEVERRRGSRGGGAQVSARRSWSGWEGGSRLGREMERERENKRPNPNCVYLYRKHLLGLVWASWASAFWKAGF